MMKYALPATALAIAVSFGVYSFMSTVAPANLSFSETSFDGGKLVMANPKLDGYTKDNRAYKMTAKRAIQDITNLDVIDLETINAALPLSGGTMASIEAAKGIYDRTRNTLKISEGLLLTTGEGLAAKLQSADIDVARGTLSTSEPIDIKNGGATITAQSMRVTEGGNVLNFEGRVRVSMDGEKVKTVQAGANNNAGN